MIPSLLLWLVSAQAGGVAVVQPGQSVADVAAAVGAPMRVEEIAALNDLAPDATPTVGRILQLPDGVGGTDCQPSYVRTLRGRGTVTPPGGPPRAMIAHQALYVGSQVCTAADSYASLRLSLVYGTDA